MGQYDKLFERFSVPGMQAYQAKFGGTASNGVFNGRGGVNWDAFKNQPNGEKGNNAYSGNDTFADKKFGPTVGPDLGSKGNSTAIQSGKTSNFSRGGGDNFFAWQGNKDGKSTNAAIGTGKDNTFWQNGTKNTASNQGTNSSTWQGSKEKADNYAQGGLKKDGVDTTRQVTGAGGKNVADGSHGVANVQQWGKDSTQEFNGKDSQRSTVEQGGDGGTKKQVGGDGRDNLTATGKNSDLNIDAGKGDDNVSVNGEGNKGNVNLKDGDGHDTLDIKGNQNGLNVQTDKNDLVKFDKDLSKYDSKYTEGKEGKPGSWNFKEKGAQGEGTNVSGDGKFRFGDNGRDLSSADLKKETSPPDAPSGGGGGADAPPNAPTQDGGS